MALLRIVFSVAAFASAADADTHAQQCASGQATCSSSGQRLLQSHQHVQKNSKQLTGTKRQRHGCPDLPYVTCDWTNELLCSGGVDDNSCYKPDTCLPVNHSDLCWPICPTSCNAGETFCPGGVDSWSGCPMPDYCQGSWTYGKDGSICPGHCYPTCAAHDLWCWGGEDANGCMLPDYCVSSNTNLTYQWYGDTFVCPSFCPHHCPDGEILTSGGFDTWTGCPLPDYCVPGTASTTSTTMISTTKTSTTTGCQSSVCAGDEFECKKGMDANGCENTTCIKVRSQTLDSQGDACWQFCPDVCGPHDVVCPGGSFNGCPLPDWCLPSSHHSGKDGSICPNHCPTECGAHGYTCWGGDDANGCPLPDTCALLSNKTDHWGNQCGQVCPTPPCLADEVKCPGFEDPWTGCDAPGYCARSWSTGTDDTACPAICWKPCGIDEHWCFGGYDDNGCEKVNTCVASGELCPEF